MKQKKHAPRPVPACGRTALGHRGVRVALWAVGAWACIAPSGCAVHKQVQYFAAIDPETGLTNYYRMTVSGSGGLGTDYHLQAGYFSAAAVDVLRGSMPDIPILDLPIEQMEVYDRLTQQFFAALIQEQKRIHNVTDREAMLVATLSRKNTAKDRVVRLKGEKKLLDEEISALTGESVINKDDLATLKVGLKTAQDSVAAQEKEEATQKKTLDDSQAAVRKAQGVYTEALRKVEGLQWRHADAEREAGHKETVASDAEKSATTEEEKTEAEKLRGAADKALKAASQLKSELRAAKEERDSKVPGEDLVDSLNEAQADYRNGVSYRIKAETKVAGLDGEIAAHHARLAAIRSELPKKKARQATIEADLERHEAASAAADPLLEKLTEAYKDRPLGGRTVPENTDPLTQEKILRLARIIWFGSLSSSDLASIGMTGNANPYQFRKLVYWTTTNNIDLNQFASEIDAILDNVTDIARSYKKQAEQRKAQREGRRNALDELLPALVGSVADEDAIRGVMALLDPDTDKDASGNGAVPLLDLFLKAAQSKSNSENNNGS